MATGLSNITSTGSGRCLSHRSAVASSVMLLNYRCAAASTLLPLASAAVAPGLESPDADVGAVPRSTAGCASLLAALSSDCLLVPAQWAAVGAARAAAMSGGSRSRWASPARSDQPVLGFLCTNGYPVGKHRGGPESWPPAHRNRGATHLETTGKVIHRSKPLQCVPNGPAERPCKSRPACNMRRGPEAPSRPATLIKAT